MYMKYTHETNFCRVFEMPQAYPSDFCFDGGHDVTFKMVDWFAPIPSDFQMGYMKDEDAKRLLNEDGEVNTDELDEMLTVFLSGKRYIQPFRKYLVIMDFGHCFYFGPVKKNCR